MTYDFSFILGLLIYSVGQSIQVPQIIHKTSYDSYFKLPLGLSLLLGFTLKVTFGLIGAVVFTEDNIFDGLIFSNSKAIIYSLFFFTLIHILPTMVNESFKAKYFVYIGGMCEVPCNYFSGMILPWIFALFFNHLNIFAYIVNWTSLTSIVYVSFITPMILWQISLKEAAAFEINFKQSLQMIYHGEKHSARNINKNNEQIMVAIKSNDQIL